ncbi:MAG: hypothetical protein OEL83_01230 [Desulforhopalus sp.]|nr:hypothetical protein [Desulforhopalus sp.]
MSLPISGDHSIEVANFVCIFENPFPASSIQALMGLKEIFKTEYPIFSIDSLWNVQIDSKDNAPISKHQIAGVSLQKLSEKTNKPAWILRTEPQSIVVSCFDYGRWDVESKKAIDDLTKVINIVDDGRNPVVQLILHVVDRFIGGPYETYKINQVFNTRSRYLSKQAVESGPLWHVHQGWFEGVHEKVEKILHNLNLSTNQTPQGIVTTIDHNARYAFVKPTSASVLNDVSYVKDIFDLLHAANKAVLIDLLNKNQCRKVKLCL